MKVVTSYLLVFMFCLWGNNALSSFAVFVHAFCRPMSCLFSLAEFHVRFVSFNVGPQNNSIIINFFLGCGNVWIFYDLLTVFNSMSTFECSIDYLRDNTSILHLPINFILPMLFDSVFFPDMLTLFTYDWYSCFHGFPYSCCVFLSSLGQVTLHSRYLNIFYCRAENRIKF